MLSRGRCVATAWRQQRIRLPKPTSLQAAPVSARRNCQTILPRARINTHANGGAVLCVRQTQRAMHSLSVVRQSSAERTAPQNLREDTPVLDSVGDSTKDKDRGSSLRRRRLRKALVEQILQKRMRMVEHTPITTAVLGRAHDSLGRFFDDLAQARQERQGVVETKEEPVDSSEFLDNILVELEVTVEQEMGGPTHDGWLAFERVWLDGTLADTSNQTQSAKERLLHFNSVTLPFIKALALRGNGLPFKTLVAGGTDKVTVSPLDAASYVACSFLNLFRTPTDKQADFVSNVFRSEVENLNFDHSLGERDPVELGNRYLALLHYFESVRLTHCKTVSPTPPSEAEAQDSDAANAASTADVEVKNSDEPPSSQDVAGAESGKGSAIFKTLINVYLRMNPGDGKADEKTKDTSASQEEYRTPSMELPIEFEFLEDGPEARRIDIHRITVPAETVAGLHFHRLLREELPLSPVRLFTKHVAVPGKTLPTSTGTGIRLVRPVDRDPSRLEVTQVHTGPHPGDAIMCAYPETFAATVLAEHLLDHESLLVAGAAPFSHSCFNSTDPFTCKPLRYSLSTKGDPLLAFVDTLHLQQVMQFSIQALLRDVVKLYSCIAFPASLQSGVVPKKRQTEESTIGQHIISGSCISESNQNFRILAFFKDLAVASLCNKRLDYYCNSQEDFQIIKRLVTLLDETACGVGPLLSTLCGYGRHTDVTLATYLQTELRRSSFDAGAAGGGGGGGRNGRSGGRGGGGGGGGVRRPRRPTPHASKDRE